MPAPTNPVKTSDIREGYKVAEAFFISVTIPPARARELALGCVNRYRQVAGANRRSRNAESPGVKGRMLRREASEMFSEAALAHIAKREGVL
jgi:hypothetical protein